MSDDQTSTGASRGVLRPIIGLLANAAILTALLVYFGWRRSATQSNELGISESILGMSTRDYALRAVRPVFVLVVCLTLLGLAWVALDRRLRGRGGPFDPARNDPSAARTRARVLLTLRVSTVALPLAALVVRWGWRSLGWTLLPAAIGVGVLVSFYSAHLQGLDAEPDADARRRNEARTVCAFVLAAACLFWTATNYADAEGMRLARAVDDDPNDLPRVVVYSTRRLGLSGPGVERAFLDGDVDDFRFQYSGLRLLEHDGGNYLLISDGWTAERGVVIVLADNDASMRLEFLTY